MVYSQSYGDLIAEIEAALSAKVEQSFTSPKVAFAGFPASLGEAGVRATLEGVGPLVAFEATESDDGMNIEGTAEFDTIDTAKKVSVFAMATGCVSECVLCLCARACVCVCVRVCACVLARAQILRGIASARIAGCLYTASGAWLRALRVSYVITRACSFACSGCGAVRRHGHGLGHNTRDQRNIDAA